MEVSLPPPSFCAKSGVPPYTLPRFIPARKGLVSGVQVVGELPHLSPSCDLRADTLTPRPRDSESDPTGEKMSFSPRAEAGEGLYQTMTANKRPPTAGPSAPTKPFPGGLPVGDSWGERPLRPSQRPRPARGWDGGLPLARVPSGSVSQFPVGGQTPPNFLGPRRRLKPSARLGW